MRRRDRILRRTTPAATRPASPSAARRALLALALLTSGALPASAQRWTLPLDVQHQVDSVFSFVERDAPGCAVGVIQDGMLVYGRGYGLANLDWQIPITTSTVFDIGSVSKQFTASAIALLDLEGVLSVDDDVRRWVPEMPEYERPITLRHLLNHTSGVRDYLTLMDLQGFEFDNVFDELDGVELIVRQQGLNFEPGSEFLYSNSGYLLLANVVRRASGMSVREYLERRFFDPLGMAHTSIWDDNTEVLAERATGYSPANGGWAINHAWNFQMGGDGQVLTSVDDMVKWDALFYDPVVGGQPLLDHLHTRGILNDGDTIDYALGLTVDEYRGLPRVQHGGAWAGFRAHLTRFPEQRTSVALMCNRSNVGTSGLTAEVVDAVLAEYLAPDEGAERGAGAPDEASPEPVELDVTQLERWAGAYHRRDRHASILIEMRDGALVIRTEGDVFRLVPYADDLFEVTPVGARLRFSGEGDNRSVMQVGNDVTYHIAESFALTDAEKQRFVGEYHSTELFVTWEVTLEDGELSLRRAGWEPTVMVPTVRDEFAAGGLSLNVERDGDRITGFRVFAGRVTGILFLKVAQ